MQLQRDIRIFCRIAPFRFPPVRSWLKVSWFLPLPAMSSKVIFLCFSQRSDNQPYHGVRRRFVQNVRLKHGIEGDTAQLNTVIFARRRDRT